MEVIREFDPWKGKLCTCPKKYSFSPYTGCSHKCLYCYASSYIPNFFNCRVKKNLIRRLIRDLTKIDRNLPISMANSSDPYPLIERDLKLTRTCLKLFKQANCRVLIITKSDLVTRDIDILKNMKVSVSISITTLNQDTASRLEPRAPSPEKRINAIKKLTAVGIPISVRLDPIIPGINDPEIENLVKVLGEIGVLHVVSSTYKARYDNWKRMIKAFPNEMKKLKRLYFKNGEKISNSIYLPKKLRFKLMKKVADACKKHNLTFATCREGFIGLHTSRSCDGSHLICDL
jgi:DNA repair photolyase